MTFLKFITWSPLKWQNAQCPRLPCCKIMAEKKASQPAALSNLWYLYQNNYSLCWYVLILAAIIHERPNYRTYKSFKSLSLAIANGILETTPIGHINYTSWYSWGWEAHVACIDIITMICYPKWGYIVYMIVNLNTPCSLETNIIFWKYATQYFIKHCSE